MRLAWMGGRVGVVIVSFLRSAPISQADRLGASSWAMSGTLTRLAHLLYWHPAVTAIAPATPLSASADGPKSFELGLWLLSAMFFSEKWGLPPCR